MGRAAGNREHGDAVVEGIARVAAALAELPAVRSRSISQVEASAAGSVLRSGWDLAAFTPTGSLVLAVLEAGGAVIELVGGVSATWGNGRRGEGRAAGTGTEGRGGIEGREGTEGSEGIEGTEGEGSGGSGGVGDRRIRRATSHGAARAAWGAPPGRRIASMGLVPGPGGDLLRMSCGVVLRLPAAALREPIAVASMLVWHAAMHAAERFGLPAPPALAAAIAALERDLALPRAPRERVAWACGVANRVVEELGAAPVAWPLPARSSEL